MSQDRRERYYTKMEDCKISHGFFRCIESNLEKHCFSVNVKIILNKHVKHHFKIICYKYIILF